MRREVDPTRVRSCCVCILRTVGARLLHYRRIGIISTRYKYEVSNHFFFFLRPAKVFFVASCAVYKHSKKEQS